MSREIIVVFFLELCINAVSHNHAFQDDDDTYVMVVK